MRLTMIILALAGLAALAGCLTSHPAACTLEEQVLSAGEQSPLGYSMEELAALVDGPQQRTFTYTGDGTETWATVELVGLDGDATFRDEEPNGDVPASWCMDSLIIDARATFSTEDGAFDEPLVGDVRSVEDDPVTQLEFSMGDPIEIEHDQLVGSYQVPGLDPSTCDTLAYTWHIVFTAGSSEGILWFSCRRTVEGSDDDDTQTTEIREEIGTW